MLFSMVGDKSVCKDISRFNFDLALPWCFIEKGVGLARMVS